MKTLILILVVTKMSGYEISDFVDYKKCNKVIDKKNYKICYSFENKGALAVWYKLDGSLVNKINIKKRPNFYNEKNIPIRYRAKLKDYKGSGMDRGHLASDASFDYDKKVQRKTYTLANVTPQYPKINRVTWLKAEKYERLMARRLKEVTVVNVVDYSEDKGVIGENKIKIPTSYTKILFNNKEKYITCLKYENIKEVDTKKDKLKSHKVNCKKMNIKN